MYTDRAPPSPLSLSVLPLSLLSKERAYTPVLAGSVTRSGQEASQKHQWKGGAPESCSSHTGWHASLISSAGWPACCCGSSKDLHPRQSSGDHTSHEHLFNRYNKEWVSLLLLYSPAVSLGFTILMRFFRMWPFFNPTTAVVTVHLRG